MMKKKIPISKILLTILFWLIGFTMLLPLVWMISTASKVEADVFNFPIEWIPKRWNFINIMNAVWGGTYHFGMYYLNSAKITLLATFLQVLVSALGAYGFSKVHFRGRDTIFLLYLATMMIPSQVTVVSQFIIMRQIGLYNTHRGIIIMMAFSVYGVFLLRQAMLGVPGSTEKESRKIFTRDATTVGTCGCTYQESGNYYSLIMAAAVSAILPLIIVFLFCQRFVVDGIASGAVKG